MRVLLGLMMLLFAAACGDAPVGDANVEVGDLNAVATAGPTVAEVLARGNDSVAVPAEPAPAAFDHLGRWAASAGACRATAWRFAAGEATTDDGTRCRVAGSHGLSATSKQLELTCTSEGFETIERWALNLHPDASMTVSRSEGGNGVPRSVTLRRCG